MWLMFWVPHPGQTVPVFEDIARAFASGGLMMQGMIVTAMLGIAVFAFFNIKLYFWNLGQMLKFQKTEGYAKLMTTNAESQMAAFPLATAMLINAGFVLGLVFVQRYLGEEVPRTVMEIGGGFGTLGEILAKSGIEGLRYVDLDIPPTSFVAQSYLTAALGSGQVSTYAETREMEEIEIAGLKTVSALCAWQIEKLRGTVDLFVNFISFQEMEPPIVANYLAQVDRLQAKYVLLRNLREGKAVKSERVQHGVETPILGGDYDGFLAAYDLLATNVRPFGYRTIDGFHSELRLYKRRVG
jgi:hypothetical protein